MKVGVVVNPVAGGGWTRREWPAIQAALEARLGSLDVAVTQRTGHARDLVAGLVDRGANLVVAVGGDGTVSETVDGLLRCRSKNGRDVAFALVPGGTGSDLARGLGVCGSHEEIASAIADRPGRRIDVGHVEFRAPAGNVATRHFINIASLGVSADIAATANSDANPLGLPGKAVFLLHTLSALARLRPAALRVFVGSQIVFEGPSPLVAVANGRCFGGGMMIAPDAQVDDGLFDVIIVRGSSRMALLAALRRVYSGTHQTLDLCSIHRGAELRVEPLDNAPHPIGMESDGEPCGFAPAAFRVLPRALVLKW